MKRQLPGTSYCLAEKQICQTVSFVTIQTSTGRHKPQDHKRRMGLTEAKRFVIFVLFFMHMGESRFSVDVFSRITLGVAERYHSKRVYLIQRSTGSQGRSFRSCILNSEITLGDKMEKMTNSSNTLAGKP